MTTRASAGLVALLMSVPATAIAANGLVGTRDPSEIYGGGPVGTCEWPTAVYINDCTGTLVHPSVVVFAAHCVAFGGQPNQVKLGENHMQPARTVGVDSCAAHPQWQNVAPGDNASDIAFCRLSTPVDDVPIVPILMGCETEALQPGAPVTLVGFGEADDGLGYGPKRKVVTDLQMVGNDAAWIGGGGKSSCYGDSGGPAYIQLDDGSWRVFGATSGSATNDPGCGQTGIWTLIHVYAPWIENTSGIDITPCHDADGTWNPSEACAAFPMAPGAGGGTWAAGCSGGEQSGIGQTCGPGLGGGESTDGGETGDAPETSGDAGTGDDGRPPSDDDGDDTGDDGSEETSDHEGTDEGGLIPGVLPPADPFTSTCACTSGASPRSAWWLAVIVLALRRRRRARTAGRDAVPGPSARIRVNA